MYLKKITTLCAFIFLSGCVSQPDGVRAVQGFDADKYLGTWYEIARLDNRFEKGMDNVTATYSRRDDGGIRVLNRGYDVAAKEWQQVEGKAYFVDNPQSAYLKVSFFGPFYGGYTVFGLDNHYQYAFVAGNDHTYLWLLARTPDIGASVRSAFLQQAENAGFNVQHIIWVNQTLPAE